MFNKVSGAATAVGSALISIIVTVLITVNFLSGIVGGIWLATKGHVSADLDIPLYHRSNIPSL